ncbi:TRAP transporter small permease [Rhizobium sp. ARZ01]|uniref:TRAP transporter small permease n=1 Tax=Rhizobium sp. ARZ01 TaxID=2769313 RepID=UPI0017816E67|nr:TRAP transporter small permease [Rhizobium sp. ARZ01]MBD9371935.1 TRAP transporter small permease [Rhizobium sp. ARZ01]
MARAIDFCFFLLKIAIALLLAGMVVLVFGNVILRYAFNTGITYSEELSRIFFVWLTFLGAVVAMREHGHLGVDTLLRRLPPAGAKAAALAGQLLMLWATWLMISGSWTQTLINLNVSAPATGISMGLFYGAGLAFGIPAFLIILWDIFSVLTGRIDVRTAELVRESEEEALEDHPEPELGNSMLKR